MSMRVCNWDKDADLHNGYYGVGVISLDVHMSCDAILHWPINTTAAAFAWGRWVFKRWWRWRWTLSMTSATTPVTLLRRRLLLLRLSGRLRMQVHLVLDDDLNSSTVVTKGVFVNFENPFEHVFNPATGSATYSARNVQSDSEIGKMLYHLCHGSRNNWCDVATRRRCGARHCKTIM